MKEKIENLYNIDIQDLKERTEYYQVKYNDENYIFSKCLRTKEDLEDLINIIKELKLKKIPVCEFMLNNAKKLLSNINNQDYIMIHVNNRDQELDLIDIIDMQNILILTGEKSRLYRNNWADLWSKKNDYFEYQINQLGKQKRTILNSFSYYLGLAENAISYVNQVNKTLNKEYVLTLSHRRIHYPNNLNDYMNPLNFIFDLRCRDMAEYLKIYFFNDSNRLDELKLYLSKVRLSNYEYHMLYARLLYPSYYFDIYEKVMNEQEDEELLIKVIDKVDDYEMFLNECFTEISKYTVLAKIEWLNK